MTRSLEPILETLRSLDSEPGLPVRGDEPSLRHTLGPPMMASELLTVSHLPRALRAFWSLAADARLFEDTAYGQWGLILHSPSTSAQTTETYRTLYPEASHDGDLVVGTFLGDTDLVIVRVDPQADDHGQVLIALPLKDRRDWGWGGHDVIDFLDRYVQARGQKFWETEHLGGPQGSR